MATRRLFLAMLALALTLAVSACNLAGAPSEEQIAQTATAAVTAQPSRTPASTSGIPTTFPVTQPTPLPTISFPTAIVVVPTRVTIPTSVPPPVFPTSTPLPVSIVILSPVPGNVVAGNVQILGSASHPQFLQYQVEFGPDPNPGNLWFPATSAITNPVLNGLLGIWNTTTVQDSRYQLRLRVYLRDGTLLTTVIPNITVQNRINTPVPSATQNIPRPIAAFSQDKASGDVPLTVQFINQSTGTINAISWNFGDGNSSNEVNPKHTFGAPGLYTVTLSVSGPGGSSNVSRQINATSPTAPVAGFTQDRLSGVAPLTVQFTDQSTGNISTRLWFFSDGTTSTELNPAHTFNSPGTYNVFLTVTGPGGSSSVTRQVTVTSSVPPTATPTSTFTPTFTPTWTFTPTFTPTATATPTNTTTVIPPSLTFTPTATFTPTFTDTATETPLPTSTPTDTTTAIPPTATFTPTFTETPLPTSTSTETPTSTFTPTATNTNVPPPQAFFSFTVAADNPLAVQFTDQTTGAVAARLWEFGDGTTSADQNPLHTYAAGGDYTVTLTVADALAQITTYSAVVSVSQPVTAGFTAQPNGLSVQFTSQSTGPVTSYLWDFGDSSGTSAEQNPSHTYGAGGTFTVTLTVSDANGRTNTTSQQVTVSAPVVANFVAQPSGLGVQITDQSSGQVASYLWDFGDSSGTSAEQNPSHTYAAGGTYTITLTVTGTNGTTSTTSQQVTVSQPVTASFLAQPTNLNVMFADQSTGPVSSYLWDFGDGGSSTEQNPQHSYAAGGTYTVTLTVTGSDGSSNSTSQQVTVSAPVAANFLAQPTDLTVQFTDQSSGQIASYLWDFGDGGSSADQNPSHTYGTGGTYTVTLIVTGTNGSSNSNSQQVTVSQPIQANFSAAPSDLNVQFTDQSTGQIASYLWDFGDGGSSADQNPSHAYSAAGTYTVTLTITGTGGTTSATSQQVTVAAAVEANFLAQPSGLNVQFADQSAGQIVAYSWNFGDGGTSADQNPLHTYGADGSYTVTLVVTGSDGRTDDQSQVVQVSTPLQANFAAAPTDLTVQFTDQSSGQIATYFWDFGDGNSSTDQNPSYTYGAGGTYTVTLTITGFDASSTSASQQVTVTAPAVEPTQPPQPTIVDTTPILPNFTALHDVLRGIYANGVNSFSNQATVFSMAGDSIFTQTGILDPFATGQYDLASNTALQPAVDWFNTTDLGGVTSFSANSLAVNPNWRAQDLLDPAMADPTCAGASPLTCELQAKHPVLMFVAVGRTDLQLGTDAATFQSMLSQIVSTIVSNGTIPVLLTLPDDGADPNTLAFSEAIISVAQTNNIPLLNAARAVNELATFNLDASPEGAGSLSSNAVTNFGVNALNLDLLQVLSDARNIIFPDA